MSAVFDTLSRFYSSSIGKKILVALTGIILVAFILGHMIGNLLVFAGPEAINEYGHMLQTSLHGAGVWIARIGLLVAVVIHVVATIQLTVANRAARKEAYGKQKFQVSSTASRTMIWSGLTILAFIIYHLMHFTVRVGNEYNNPALYSYDLNGHSVHNVYKMVIDGFSWWPASVFYVIAMVLLCSHLGHGVASIFQTLGLTTHRTWPLIKKAGMAFALLILVGNCSIPIAILVFGYGR
ncbi:succinate dehydrogenase / fumarate reductase cytochrome b subunit [Prosthecobacter fusiformis]|uniref:Succinate dehydrogenase / fumarate reductase cytochrome b subunit n=1 Tax=Prosthecobacter fusiformis TaxID=48464 RepID=A0A4V3FDZ1_9BACT|nr:succinate dehydrogenase cytochrome b subunit [Prosthecobacter fusiformis]TDU63100.1 succinate dehydrogenase / fumarate reductase cytochrome b subunit [Prosthecobacter fusiformis]